MQKQLTKVPTITKKEIVTFLSENSNLKFRPNQGNVSFPIIERICRRLHAGNEFSPIQVANGVVIDGHHRYISLSFLKLNVETVQVDENHSQYGVLKWHEINIDSNDYDSIEERQEYEEKYDK